MVKEMEEKVKRIIHNSKEAQARQKSYVDKRRKPLYFQVRDHVYLKVSPMKGVSHFGRNLLFCHSQFWLSVIMPSRVYDWWDRLCL
jgi:hypothetical protein